MKHNVALLLTLFAAITMTGCSSSLAMQKVAQPIPTKFAQAKTGAYAEVNSPKNQGEVYLAKSQRNFQLENGKQKLTLDPASFHNAYSFVEVSYLAVKGKSLAGLQIMVQGENFADAYKTPVLKGSDAKLVCDGNVGQLSYKGVAQSAINDMMEPVDLTLTFELTDELKAACP